MFLGQTAALVLLGAGKEVVLLNLNDGHAVSLILALLSGDGFLRVAPVFHLSQLLDLLLEFRGQEVGEDQQTTGQSWHHQNLTSSEKKMLETFFLVFQVPDVTEDLTADTETGGES